MLQLIESARFIAISLSNLINNLSEGIHEIKCKYGHHDKKCETYINIATGFLNTQTLKLI